MATSLAQDQDEPATASRGSTAAQDPGWPFALSAAMKAMRVGIADVLTTVVDNIPREDGVEEETKWRTFSTATRSLNDMLTLPDVVLTSRVQHLTKDKIEWHWDATHPSGSPLEDDSMAPAALIMWIHGGGFVWCSPWTHRGVMTDLVLSTSYPVAAVSYRQPPEHHYPAQLDDCEAALLSIRTRFGSKTKIFIGGDSAGGNLALSLARRLTEKGLEQASGLILLSPWVRLDDVSSNSFMENKDYDYLPPGPVLPSVGKMYAGDIPLDDPRVSPFYSADLDRLPPVLLEIAELETLRDQCLAFAEKLRGAGVRVDSYCSPSMMHCFPCFTGLMDRQHLPQPWIFFDRVRIFMAGVVGDWPRPPHACEMFEHQKTRLCENLVPSVQLS
eukprot:TRINITY_DN19377_c0_g1_i5.p1 TRINITY_DN19377_c0_g1~~TRINITY_DN19377_c0_g1_i5.p1  ORF type:complete len:387 (-),score=50.91 TRINITY_DN19377_c0_g1_i5:117-1277(-)